MNANQNLKMASKAHFKSLSQLFFIIKFSWNVVWWELQSLTYGTVKSCRLTDWPLYVVQFLTYYKQLLFYINSAVQERYYFLITLRFPLHQTIKLLDRYLLIFCSNCPSLKCHKWSPPTWHPMCHLGVAHRVANKMPGGTYHPGHSSGSASVQEKMSWCFCLYLLEFVFCFVFIWPEP